MTSAISGVASMAQTKASEKRPGFAKNDFTHRRRIRLPSPGEARPAIQVEDERHDVVSDDRRVTVEPTGELHVNPYRLLDVVVCHPCQYDGSLLR